MRERERMRGMGIGSTTERRVDVFTFLIAHVHGPFRALAEVVDGGDDTFGISFCGVLLHCLQQALELRNREFRK